MERKENQTEPKDREKAKQHDGKLHRTGKRWRRTDRAECSGRLLEAGLPNNQLKGIFLL